MAHIVKAHGGIDPKTVGDYATLPEELHRLSLMILKKGGVAPDDMFASLKESYPGELPFTDAGDMVRYFVDGRHEYNLKRQKRFADEEAEYYRRKLGLSDEGFEALERSAETEVQAEIGDREREREAVRAEAAGESGPPLTCPE